MTIAKFSDAITGPLIRKYYISEDRIEFSREQSTYDRTLRMSNNLDDRRRYLTYKEPTYGDCLSCKIPLTFPPAYLRRPIVSRLSLNLYNEYDVFHDWLAAAASKKKCFDDSDDPNDEAQTVREIFFVLGCNLRYRSFFLSRISLIAGNSRRYSVSFFFFGFTTFIALTLIFTVNTCIVLFLQLQSRARTARSLQVFACFAPLSPLCLERPVSLVWILL